MSKTNTRNMNSGKGKKRIRLPLVIVELSKERLEEISYQISMCARKRKLTMLERSQKNKIGRHIYLDRLQNSLPEFAPIPVRQRDGSWSIKIGNVYVTIKVPLHL
jgi:hypothetical protein